MAKNFKTNKGMPYSFVEKNSNRQDLKKILPLRMPLGLCIEPINFCNYRCVYCPVSMPQFKEIVGGVGVMDMNLYRKIISDVKKMGKLKNLNLYGDGEPLLNGNIAEMVKLAKEADVAENITITTNASLLSEKISKELISSGLTYLRVSIYSIYQDKFEKNTRVKNISVDDIHQNLKNFRKLREKEKQKTPHLYIKMIDTYSDENEKFLKIYSGIADQVNIETPMNWNGYNSLDFISKIDPERKTDETKIQGFYKDRGKPGYKEICTTAFHSLNIKVNGDVTICIVDWNKGTKVGNIGNESLPDIWFGEKLRSFRRIHIKKERHRNPSCKNCKYLYCNPDNIDNLTKEKYEEILNFKE